LPASTAGTTPLLRLFYPDGRGLHLWTTDQNEYDTLRTSGGWTAEGTAGFMLP
jgi:hypothetical protein